MCSLTHARAHALGSGEEMELSILASGTDRPHGIVLEFASKQTTVQAAHMLFLCSGK